MKKLIMAIVCLMTMVVSVNAGDNIYGEWKCNFVNDSPTEETIFFKINEEKIIITYKGDETILTKTYTYMNNGEYYFRIRENIFGAGKIEFSIRSENFTNDLAVLVISGYPTFGIKRFKLTRVK